MVLSRMSFMHGAYDTRMVERMLGEDRFEREGAFGKGAEWCRLYIGMHWPYLTCHAWSVYMIQLPV